MKKMYEGVLGETPFFISQLQLEHLPAIEKLQHEVYETLEDKSILQPLSTEEFEYMLEGNGMMIGAYVKDELIAFRALLNPPIDEEHLGYDCGINEELFPKILYQEISGVSPKYRGYGLQKTLANVIMNHVELDTYDYVCATVKPFNIASLKDKFAQNMHVAALKLKYGGKLRYVFLKDLRENRTVKFGASKSINMKDTEAQQALLKAGWIGVKMEKQGDQWFVIYQQVVA